LIDTPTRTVPRSATADRGGALPLSRRAGHRDQSGLTRPGPNRWVPGSRRSICGPVCEGSLKRLRVDRSMSTSFTVRIPRSHSRNRFAPGCSLRMKGRSGTSDCPTSASTARARAEAHADRLGPDRYSLMDRLRVGPAGVLARGVAFIPGTHWKSVSSIGPGVPGADRARYGATPGRLPCLAAGTLTRHAANPGTRKSPTRGDIGACAELVGRAR